MKRLILPIIGFARSHEFLGAEPVQPKTYKGFDVHFTYKDGEYTTTLFIGTPA